MKANRRLWRWAELACAAALAVCATLLARDLSARLARQREQAASGADMAAVKVEASDRVVEEPRMFGRAAALLERNPDLVGMVGYGGRSMYVCQGDDNRWYASHRFDGAEDPAGMIYMDCRCAAWPLGENTILYGHSMRDGGRFGTLNRFEDPAYLVEHPRVRYATLYELREFVPFAVLRLSVDPASPDYFAFDRPAFASREDFDAFVAAARARSELDLSGAAVGYGDRLLTLATCSEEGPGGRLVVMCVEREAGE